MHASLSVCLQLASATMLQQNVALGQTAPGAITIAHTIHLIGSDFVHHVQLFLHHLLFSLLSGRNFPEISSGFVRKCFRSKLIASEDNVDLKRWV